MKKDKNTSDLDDLLNKYLEGSLTEEEALALSNRIEQSSEVRERYWELASIHGMVEQTMQTASLQATTGRESAEPERIPRVPELSRIKTGIAGLAIGVFSASVVWAFNLPQDKKSNQEVREIVTESFEDPDTGFKGRFPSEAGKWFGEISSISEDEMISSASGVRVAKFGDNPKAKFTYARYLIDLDEYAKPGQNQSRSVRVEASFFASNPDESSVFQIRLAAFSQEPQDVRPIWNDQEVLFDQVLQHVGRNHITTLGQKADWQRLEASIEIPPGTRILVISLGAGMVDPNADQSNHYLDDIRVSLVDSPRAIYAKSAQ
ncbi:MAG: hypothetical protein HOA16_09800 [Opitutae bacterium]|nr:hypothetical protein [Opitutae bacterium]MBT7924835.1 hypothetical protein [Opitutae bacterium]